MIKWWNADQDHHSSYLIIAQQSSEQIFVHKNVWQQYLYECFTINDDDIYSDYLYNNTTQGTLFNQSTASSHFNFWDIEYNK